MSLGIAAYMLFESYVLLKLLHILLFVYWLGADVGVFHSVRYVTDTSLSLEARKTALQILGWIDQLPRYSLVLMLPVGYTLAWRLGVATVPEAVIVLLWAIALAWLWMVWAIHHWKGTTLGNRLRNIDLGWRWLLVFGLVWDAVQGFRGVGHLSADWLSLKFLIFAALIFCGILLRIVGKPLGPALMQVLSTGSTPELETVVKQTFARTRPFVLAIWALLLVSAYVGLAKPNFG